MRTRPHGRARTCRSCLRGASWRPDRVQVYVKNDAAKNVLGVMVASDAEELD